MMGKVQSDVKMRATTRGAKVLAEQEVARGKIGFLVIQGPPPEKRPGLVLGLVDEEGEFLLLDEVAIACTPGNSFMLADSRYEVPLDNVDLSRAVAIIGSDGEGHWKEQGCVPFPPYTK